MASLHVGGVRHKIPNDQIESIKAKITDLKPGGYTTVDITDSDGDAIWIYVPYGAAVIIEEWDPFDPTPEVRIQPPPNMLPRR